MSYRILTRDEHLRPDGRPKRILALDGGGLRGVVSLGLLQRIEALLQARHGASKDFRLCHYFDLIAGTSTGAIIAACLAMGWTTTQVCDHYFELGERAFRKSLLRDGYVRARYDQQTLVAELKRLFGEDTTLGGPQLLTGLMIMTKRLDTGSPWPMSNNPQGRYFAPSTDGTIGNGDFPLWQVVRASTAAPTYFDPEFMTIASPKKGAPVRGNFVDGGVSPFNNPALQAVMYSTLEGYRIGWETGEDKLLLVSVGTGTKDPTVARPTVATEAGVSALLSLMEDCAMQQQMILQWMSASRTARPIDSEVGHLQGDLLGGRALLSYLRYDVDLRPECVAALDPAFAGAVKIGQLSRMDAPKNMSVLHRLGTLAAQRDIRGDDFTACFDLDMASYE
ncbi:MAG TPA: patatin-like phospholipase family protein [Paraburkholderia sp.]|nr:patatin-like phospholipase family protein [Paraburkholderia sp.]